MSRKIYSQEPQEYVRTLAASLREIKEFKVPEWATFVKSGASRKRPPVNEDFWYTRAASILRQLYIKGVVGVGKLRTRYGSKKDRGGRPDEFRKASGKIIRLILQQAEKAGLAEQETKFQHGRRLTEKGREFLDKIEVAEVAPLVLDDLVVEDKPQEDLQEEYDTPEEDGSQEGDEDIKKVKSKEGNE